MLHSQLAYPILKLYKVAMAHDSISLYLRKAYFCKARCLFNSVYFSSLLNSNKWKTNPANGQSGTRTHAHRIATPTRLPLGQAASFKSNSVGIQTYSSDRLLHVRAQAAQTKWVSIARSKWDESSNLPGTKIVQKTKYNKTKLTYL